MDKPTWIERIMSDTQSYRSFMDFVEQNETALLTKMRDAITTNEMDLARVYSGESNAWKQLKHQIRMYEREEEQHGIIQTQVG